MDVKFLEPGGDADFLVGTTNGFWGSLNGTPSIATDFVHGGHQKSIKYPLSQSAGCLSKTGTLADAGSRISLYIFINAYGSSGNINVLSLRNSSGTQLVNVRITSTGVLQLWNANTAQIGSNGPTLSTGQWYRISIAYTITSTTVNSFKLWVNGGSLLSVTNATLSAIGTSIFAVGNLAGDIIDLRSSDHYIDDSTSLTDPGNIWVTAKRPNANGITNGFSTQIGSGGSGYGSGHSSQVNERPLSTTNGWSMVGAGSAVTEEYNIEAQNVGDIDISTATIVDWLGWVSAKSLVGETGNVIIDGASVAQAITTTPTLYTKIKGSTTYPSGTGADIGFQTTTALTTVSLYECGVIVAYIPAGGSTPKRRMFPGIAR
jgi:hypothetical protein